MQEVEDNSDRKRNEKTQKRKTEGEVRECEIKEEKSETLLVRERILKKKGTIYYIVL